MDCNIITKSELKEWSEVDPEYKLIVLDAIHSDKNLDIENSDMDHAKFLSYCLLKKSKSQVKIFTGNLKETFYSDDKIFGAFEAAVNRGVSIKIITSENPEPSKILKLYKKNKENLKLFKLRNKSVTPNHFMLVDDSSYRLEAPHTEEEIKKNKVRGVVNFNDSSLAKKISLFFDRTLSSNAEMIEIK